MYLQSQIIELLINAIPYPNQIKEIDITTEEDSVRFSWRNSRYRVSKTLSVDQIQNGCLIGSDEAILMRRCLEQSATYKELND